VFYNVESWVDAYFNNRSGTYNNQWILVDFANYTAQKGNLENATNIIWFIEEFYNFTSTEDVTPLLINQSYVASYNLPYNQSLQNVSDDNSTYNDCPRQKLFAQYAPNVENMEGMQWIMRYNNFSYFDNWCMAIASRCDLGSNTTFPFGAIDSKITSNYLIGNQEAMIIAGPTTEFNIEAFTWSNWTQYVNESLGMPILYEFTWQLVTPQNFSGAMMISS